MLRGDRSRHGWGQALAGSGDDTFSIDLSARPTRWARFRTFQFVGYDEIIRAEVVENDFFDPAYRMDGDRENALVAIGWEQRLTRSRRTGGST